MPLIAFWIVGLVLAILLDLQPRLETPTEESEG